MKDPNKFDEARKNRAEGFLMGVGSTLGGGYETLLAEMFCYMSTDTICQVAADIRTAQEAERKQDFDDPSEYVTVLCEGLTTAPHRVYTEDEWYVQMHADKPGGKPQAYDLNIWKDDLSNRWRWTLYPLNTSTAKRPATAKEANALGDTIIASGYGKVLTEAEF